jgi:predicted nucleotide-binding protein (sugar kinase/HSP70/actin superfamily)
LVVTFPHMGNIYLAVKALFDDLDIDYIIPPPNTKASLQKGSFYSPEEICLPFKLFMGNIIQAIESGADTVLITGSCGPCRFGEYSELASIVLREMGHDLDFIVLDLSKDVGVDGFLRRISKITRDVPMSRTQKVRTVLNAAALMAKIDQLEARAHILAGYEKNAGDCKRILHQALARGLECVGSEEIGEAISAAQNEIERIPIDLEKDPLRVAIIGEIYTVIEPFSNLYIEDLFMDYGVCVKRHMTPSWWLRDLVMKPLKLNSLDLRRSSREYLPLYIGGHGRECVGEAVKAWQEGMDGAIQILPMGCMPEIVAKAILPQIQNDKDFPILTLIVDEMTGREGYITRIEAFLDMLKKRRERYRGGSFSTGILSGINSKRHGYNRSVRKKYGEM